jgi:hypothetical protein
VPSESKRGPKTMALSLRLDPKTRFILEFVARIKGQSITTVVERAIKETADGLGIGPRYDEQGNIEDQLTWSDFWDPSEGVRTLRVLNSSDCPTTYDEDELRAFTLAHWPFFYTDQRRREPHRTYVDVLWPKIGAYAELWREKKRSDYWAAGEAMQADLAAARIAPPDWPPKPEPKTDPADIEIPF